MFLIVAGMKVLGITSCRFSAEALQKIDSVTISSAE
jgi:hypothetical protein